MRGLAFVALILATCAPLASAQRLPADAVPLHYQVTFAPDLVRERFDGEETIDIRVDKPTARLTLNSLDLSISEAAILVGGRSSKPDVAMDPGRQQVSFALRRRLEPGVVTLRLRFSGALNRELRGLYLSQSNGRKYAVTQFEATDARRAFPCFDEPAFKASFSLSAVIDAADTAISNGRVVSSTPGPGAGKRTIRFETTPRMSSYLVALAVGDFECLEGKAGEIPVRACATPDKKDLGRFALDAAQHILAFYADYFSVRYPFGKLDLVAIPDFSAGAMENTAAIFFREDDLLVEPASALAARYEVAATVSHEIAHQWFGDLVTMRWWDDLWLNEGFATWMENKPILGWMPEWHAELAEVQSASRAMEADQLPSARAIRSPVATPGEIDEAFDAIAYDKGAAVLRMIEGYVGAETFRAGVNAYLRRFAYDNASAEDFWNEVAKASGKPVDRVMPAFIDRPGVPAVMSRARCEGDGRTEAAFSQRRFLVTPPEGPATPARPWRLPIEVRGVGAATVGGTTMLPVLLSALEQEAPLPGCHPIVLANAGARGYFRTEYGPQTIARLAAVGPAALTPAERLRLLNDEWALVRGGVHGIETYLSLVEGFAGDRTPQVIEEMASPLAFVHDYLVTGADRAAFESWVRRVFGPPGADLGAAGWIGSPDEDDDRRQRRGAVMRILGATGRDPAVLARARILAQESLDGGRVDPTLLPTLARLAALAADAPLYARMAAAAVRPAAANRQEVMLGGLTAVTDPELLSRVLDFASSDGIRSQDTAMMLGDLLRNPDTNRSAWAFITSHWSALDRKLEGLFATPALVAAASSFCDTASRHDVKRFFEERVPEAKQTLRQTLDQIDTCIAVRQREAPRLADRLKR